MTIHKAIWLLVGLVCLALWPSHAPAQGGQWESYMAAGVAAYQQGDYAEAEKLYSAALKNAEGFGPQAPRLATNLNNLAQVYYTRGKYAQAEPLHKRSLAIREKALGPDHPHVAISLMNYAAPLRETGRSAEAAKMVTRAKAIRAKHGKETGRDATEIQVADAHTAANAQGPTQPDPECLNKFRWQPKLLEEKCGNAAAETSARGAEVALKPGDSFKDCPDCPEMVVVPAGSFRMGDLSGEGFKDEKPVHDVRIGYSFAVGKYEVTQAEWRSVMGNDPSEFKGDRNPVERVSWNDAKAFVKRLSAKTGKTYRLPSESEWEYVARADTSTRYWWGNTASHDYANYGTHQRYSGQASGRSRWQYTSPVGSFSANGFGVHDMHGNVWEWTEDCWHDSYNGAPTDGGAWTTGGKCFSRILRGGYWFVIPSLLRSAYRVGSNSGDRYNSRGFRVARTLP